MADKNVQLVITGQDKTQKMFATLKKNVNNATKSTVAFGNKMQTLSPAFENIGKKAGIAFAAIGAGAGALALAGADLKSTEMAYERMTNSVGINSQELLESLQEASAGTIAMKDIMLSSNKAIALGVGETTEEITTLLEVARLKGQNMGLSTKQAFDDIVTGLGRSSPMILDNLGITIKLTEAYELEAKALGKTTEALTADEKKRALVNAVVRQGTEELRQAGEVQVTAKERIQQIGASLQDAAGKAGTAFLPIIEKVGAVLVKVINRVTTFVENNKKLVAVLTGVALALTGMVTLVSGLAVGLGSLAGVLVSVKTIMAAFGTTTAAASVAVKAFLVAAAPMAIMLGALAVGAYAVSKALNYGHDMQRQYNEKLMEANNGFMAALKGQDEFADAVTRAQNEVQMAKDQLAAYGQEIEAVNAKIADAVKDSEERQKGYKQSKADLFVEQEQKIKDLEEKLIDEKKNLRQLEKDDASRLALEGAEERVATLKEELATEKEALELNADEKIGLDAEIKEAKRRAALTDFERRVEDVNKDMVLEKKRLAEKVKSLNEEKAVIMANVAQVKAQKLEAEKAVSDAQKKQAENRIKMSFEEARAVVESEMVKAAVRGESTKKYERQLDKLNDMQVDAVKRIRASDSGIDDAEVLQLRQQAIDVAGGSTAADTPNFWDALKGFFSGNSSSVNDAIISPSGDIITTHPEDYLIATKNPQGLANAGGGGVHINLAGSVLLSDSVAEEIGDKIIGRFQLQDRAGGMI